jgi:hypothetical protein
MTITTMVAILTGGTGTESNMIGSGTLIKANSVLVHPPLSHTLANDGMSTSMKVCVASWQAAGPDVEVIDVTAVNVPAEKWGAFADKFTAHRHPVVELVLRSAARSPAVLADFGSASKVLAHLADPFNGPATDATPHNPNPLCLALGIGC